MNLTPVSAGTLTLPVAEGSGLSDVDPAFLGLCTYVWDDSDNGDLDIIADMGLVHVRIDNPSQTEIEDCQSRGLVCLPIAAYNPWYATLAAPGATDDKYPPTPANMATWASNMVAQWSGLATQPPAIEVWNEPWLSNFWKPTPDAEDYYLLVRALAEAAWAVWPDMTILWSADTAGSSPYDDGSWRDAVLAFDVGTGTSVITNSSFETDTSGWSAVLTTTITRSSGAAFVGSWSLLVETGTDFGGASTSGLGGSGHQGETWWGTARVKAKEAGDVGKVIDLIIIQEGTGEQFNNPFTLTADWQFIAAAETLATAGTTMRLDFRAHDAVATAFYLDDVEFYEETATGFLNDTRVLPTTHNYVEARTPTTVTGQPCWWDFDRYECAYDDVLAHGHPDPQVWVTEFGWESDDVGEQNQADYTIEAVDIAAASGKVARIYAFFLNRGSSWSYNWLDTDDSEKTVIGYVRGSVLTLPTVSSSSLTLTPR